MPRRATTDDVFSGRRPWAAVLADCRDAMTRLPDASIDAIVSDPIYPEIRRHYGRITEGEWHELMRSVVAEARRILKPQGSAVFILQPNSERVGRMRAWLWEFMAWTAREWNQVQDAWWWNTCALPTGGAAGGAGEGKAAPGRRGLLRSSVKACVWLGAEDCWRDQDAVLWSLRDGMTAEHVERRAKMTAVARYGRLGKTGFVYYPSGAKVKPDMEMSTIRRGGATPFNLLPAGNDGGKVSAGSRTGHGAATPYPVAAWWIRYICPPGGVVLDPFGGAFTMARAALDQGRRAIMIEKDRECFAMGHKMMRIHGASDASR